MKKRIYTLGHENHVFDIFVYAISSIVLVITLYPLIYIVSASISDPLIVTQGELVLFPRNITFEGYQRIFEYDPVWLGYRNSLFYTVFGTIINLLFTLPCAYSLSRKDLPLRKIFTILFTFTMFFSGGLIPSYLVIRQLNLLDTVWAVMLPGAISIWNMIIARTYFQNSIPIEMQEAAIMDGSSNTRLLMTIVLPLSMPMIAVIMLYYAVGHWNSYFGAMIYLSNKNLYPLQLFLRNILVMDQMQDLMNADSDLIEEFVRRMQLKESMKFGLVVVSSLPVMILYPLLQRYFVKGVMIGALKG